MVFWYFASTRNYTTVLPLCYTKEQTFCAILFFLHTYVSKSVYIAHAVRYLIGFCNKNQLRNYVGCNFMSIGELVKPMTCKVHDTFLTDFPEKSIKQLTIQFSVMTSVNKIDFLAVFCARAHSCAYYYRALYYYDVTFGPKH